MQEEEGEKEKREKGGRRRKERERKMRVGWREEVRGEREKGGMESYTTNPIETQPRATHNRVYSSHRTPILEENILE